ncbi:MAG: hypothetical protein JWN17_913 [Frankiales bacterium]|nr:hypothetical protein [Frankiales bacterium]
MDPRSAPAAPLGLGNRRPGALQAAPSPRSGSRPARAPKPPRPVPVRDDAYGHLGLDALREYRTALQAEESKVSYWRRIIQARLDVVQAGSGTSPADDAHLRPVLADARVSSGRTALVEVLQVDDIPPLPSLAELWDRRVLPSDAEGTARLEADLADAEQQLSAYRAALHRRLADATGELIARYREQPSLCLTALPLRPSRLAVGS